MYRPDVDGLEKAESSPYRALDARTLRGLAHPLRVRILGILRTGGPATSTMLAERLKVRSGTTSWHLQKLAEHGFIEEVRERGNRRDRWWQARGSDWSIDAGTFMEDPAVSGPTTVLLDEVINQSFQRAARFLHEAWPKEWRQAWILQSTESLVLDAASLASMRADIWAVVQRYLDAPVGRPGAERVTFQMQGFPYRTNGEVKDASSDTPDESP